MTFNSLLAILKKHKWKISLSLIALIVAILMLTIGFSRTLLIIVLTVPGFLYGYLLDRLGFVGANKAIANFFRRK